MTKPKISSVVASQLPEFIREDYSTFVSFVEAYYEYLSTIETRDLESIRDLDKTLDSFVDYLKSELAINTPNVLIDKRRLLQHIKDYYLSKGTEASYKFLFRILFNKEVIIDYPSQQILRASDGRWQQDVSLFVRVRSGDWKSIVGNIVNIYTSAKTVQVRVQNAKWAKVWVDGVQQVSNEIVEVFIDRKLLGTIESGNVLQYGAVFDGIILPTTQRLRVIIPGTGFRVGQLFRIKNGTGDGSIIKVREIDSNGGIRIAEFIKFGLNYSTDFITTLGANPLTLEAGSLGISNNNITIVEVGARFVEAGLINKADYAVDAWDGTYSGEILRNYYYDESQAGVDPENSALISIELGPIAKYPGYYSSVLGFLDDAIYIQDSEYYQAFSYVIKIDEKLEMYKNAVKSTIHPAGLALFSEYQLNNTFEPGVTLESFLKFLSYKYSDSFSVQDIKSLLTSKPVSDSFGLTDSSSRLTTKGIVVGQASPVDDGSSKLVSKAASDSISTPTDAINKKDTTKALAETVTQLDALTKGLTKALADATSGNTDLATLLTTKLITDTVTITDAAPYVYRTLDLADSNGVIDRISAIATGKSAADSFGAIDNILFADNKATTDQFSLDDVGTLVISKTITDPDAVIFSETGSIEVNPYVDGYYFLENYAVYDRKVTF